MLHTRIKGLDGLRGIAAIAVFLTHYDQIVFIETAYGYFDLGQLFENGKFAVALFFILSGYLLYFARSWMRNFYHADFCREQGT